MIQYLDTIYDTKKDAQRDSIQIFCGDDFTPEDIYQQRKSIAQDAVDMGWKVPFVENTEYDIRKLIEEIFP